MSAGKENEQVAINLFKTLIRRKWWFAGSFILILIAGIIISFVRVPVYNARGTIKVINNYIYYNDIIYKYFPEESGDLWIFPSGQETVLEMRAIYQIQNTIESGQFLEQAGGRMKDNLSREKLAGIINIKTDEDEKQLDLYVTAEDPLLVAETIDTIFGLVIENRRSELDDLRLKLIDEIDIKTGEIKKEIESLSGRDTSEVLVPLEIDALFEDYYNLKQIGDSLVENEELFSQRLEIVSQPDTDDVSKITSKKRDLIISVFASLILGAIIALVADGAYSLKNRKMQ